MALTIFSSLEALKYFYHSALLSKDTIISVLNVWVFFKCKMFTDQ